MANLHISPSYLPVLHQRGHLLWLVNVRHIWLLTVSVSFWLELACGGAALVIFMTFVRIDKAKSDFTADEKEAQRAAEEGHP